MRLGHLATIGALAVGGQAAAQSPIRASAVRSLFEAESLFSITASKNLLTAFRSILAPDAVFLEPGEQIARGKDDALAAIARADSSGEASGTWMPVRVEVAGDGTQGYSIGYGTVHVSGASLGEKYISYWRRERDRWLLVAHVRVFQRQINPLPPAAGVDELTAMRRASPPTGERGAQAMLGRDRAFSDSAQLMPLADAFKLFAADDAAALSGGPAIVFGKASVGQGFATLPAGTTLVWKPTDVRLAPTGDLGFTVGEARLTIPGSNAPARVSYSKYITVWRWSDRGRWEFVADGGNARPSEK
jgi:ketosteroid isomerase-like protein